MVHESTGTLTSAVANIKNGMFYSNGITLALLHSTLWNHNSQHQGSNRGQGP